MATQTLGNGRFCNQVFRNIAVSLIAEKCDLMVNYISCNDFDLLGIRLYKEGQKVYATTNCLTDQNYMEMYNNPEQIVYNLNPNNDFFQTREISKLVYSYIYLQKETVISSNPFKLRYLTNNDVCIHIRLTDASHHNPGVNYYINVLTQITYDNIYIATDESNHLIVHGVLAQFPSAKIVELDPIHTLQFASTCKHVILSHGSFSATIGYLSYYSNVHYPKYDPHHIWYGDMFSIDGWNEHEYLH